MSSLDDSEYTFIATLLHFIGGTPVEWTNDSWGNVGFLPAWQEYKRQVAPRAKAFLITIAPYRVAVAPESSENIHYIYGWHEHILRYIHLMQTTPEAQVSYVKSLDLPVSA